MNVIELIMKLEESHVVQEELPMQMRLGLPLIERKNGRICIGFRPHKEDYKDGCFRIYRHQFEIGWVYPFEHLAYFRNLTLEGQIDVSMPIAKISEKQMLIYQYKVKELYDEGTRILTTNEKKGQVTDVMLERYRRYYDSTVEALGLSLLYQK